MSSEGRKQRIKNSVYRALGEVGSLTQVGGRERVLTVLMYHKINDQPANTLTVPVGLFDEQMAQVRQLGYRVVSLNDVLAYYTDRVALPERALLITFDDAYRDVLDNAAPILRKHRYQATMFAPTGFLDGAAVLPHDVHLLAKGLANPTLDWPAAAELESAGIVIQSHGVSHQPFSRLSLAEAESEIRSSKAILEDRLGHSVFAFAFVKGSMADFAPTHVDLVREAGFSLAVTTISGANRPQTDPLQLRRYNVEPYDARTFELVLRGACDLIALKDTKIGTRARALFNTALGTSTR